MRNNSKGIPSSHPRLSRQLYPIIQLQQREWEILHPHSTRNQGKLSPRRWNLRPILPLLLWREKALQRLHRAITWQSLRKRMTLPQWSSSTGSKPVSLQRRPSVEQQPLATYSQPRLPYHMPKLQLRRSAAVNLKWPRVWETSHHQPA